MIIINIIVAFSNFFVLYYKNLNYWVLFPMCASFVYHLAEVKHNLDGFPGLRDYANPLLDIDRFFALISGLYIFKTILTKDLSLIFYIVGLFGILALLYSEKDYIYLPLTYIEFT